MSSEIEVVEEIQLNNPKENGESSSKAIEEESLKNDVYTAAAYGDLEKLHKLVECEGSSVSEPDGLGYYALQWSALNNRVAVAQYIIEVTTPQSLFSRKLGFVLYYTFCLLMFWSLCLLLYVAYLLFVCELFSMS